MNMDFKTSFERYRDGTASDEEKRFIESELEKHELIEEYFTALCESTPTPEEDPAEQEAAEFAKKVKKTTNRKFRNIGLVTGSILLVLVLFFTFGLSPLVDSLYYNPTKTLDEEGNFQRITLDMDIYTELNNYMNIPYTYAEAEGFGKYRVNLSFFEFLTTSNEEKSPSIFQYSKISAAFIDKGNYRPYDPSLNISSSFGLKSPASPIDDELTQEILDLYYKDNIYATVCVQFEDGLSVNDMIEFHQKFNFRNPSYGVKITDGSEYPQTLSFKTGAGGSSLSTTRIEEDEKYPMLRARPSSGSAERYDTSRMDYGEMRLIRFLSMLDYMSDQKQFLKMMGDDPAVYQAAYDYVEENGMTILKIEGYISREDVMRMVNDPAVSTISISHT